MCSRKIWCWAVFPPQILDTAGIRKTADTVEKIGVDRALEHAKDADLILYVVDASVPLDENDAKIMEILKGRKAIVFAE